MKKVQAVLDLFDIAPMTAEERTVLRDEWFMRTLNHLYLTALGNRDLKKAFCTKADSLKKPISPRSLGALHALLVHYACIVEPGDDMNVVIDELIDYNQRMTGNIVSRDTMQNRISTALSKIRIDDLPDFARPAIQARIDRGKKLHRG